MLKKHFSNFSSIPLKDQNIILTIENKVFSSNLNSIYKVYEIEFKLLYSEEKLVGYVSYQEENDIIEIYNIAVDPNDIKKGYGTILINSFDDKAVILDVKKVNHVAKNFYEKVGFVVYDDNVVNYKMIRR